eukprot:753387-Hanusia_phi.AAC.3
MKRIRKINAENEQESDKAEHVHVATEIDKIIVLSCGSDPFSTGARHLSLSEHDYVLWASAYNSLCHLSGVHRRTLFSVNISNPLYRASASFLDTTAPCETTFVLTELAQSFKTSEFRMGMARRPNDDETKQNKEAGKPESPVPHEVSDVKLKYLLLKSQLSQLINDERYEEAKIVKKEMDSLQEIDTEVLSILLACKLLNVSQKMQATLEETFKANKLSRLEHELRMAVAEEDYSKANSKKAEILIEQGVAKNISIQARQSGSIKFFAETCFLECSKN